MLYGICNLSIVPLRIEASDASEMVSQVLFGEDFLILKKEKKWSKIRLSFDGYEGYIDNKQYLQIDEETFDKLADSANYYSSEIIDFVTNKKNHLSTIAIGSRLPFYKNQHLLVGSEDYYYDGNVYSEKLNKYEIIQKAYQFLNTPYLWGGKTPFGIDCSGFTQLVYKICGYSLLRDAKDQATQGEVLSFIEESEPGDLAFFDNEEGNIIHVGIIMNDYNIIHAHGKVRIDTLDHSGIYNVDTKMHTHKLRIIKRLIQ